MSLDIHKNIGKVTISLVISVLISILFTVIDFIINCYLREWLNKNDHFHSKVLILFIFSNIATYYLYNYFIDKTEVEENKLSYWKSKVTSLENEKDQINEKYNQLNQVLRTYLMKSLYKSPKKGELSVEELIDNLMDPNTDISTITDQFYNEIDFSSSINNI